MPKSADAFRTISEVADWLGIQAHVLRFWESKFTQVKPIKRAGGRRYYRPADMLLLGGIKKLLHDDGLTIKGVQKILREDGMSHVSSLSIPLDEDHAHDVAAPPRAAAMAPQDPPEPTNVVVPFESEKKVKDDAQDTEIKTQKDDVATKAPDANGVEDMPTDIALDAPSHAAPASPAEPANDSASSAEISDGPDQNATPEPPAKLPSFLSRPLQTQDQTPTSDNPPPDPEPAATMADQQAPETVRVDAAEPSAELALKPRVVDVPPFTAEADFPARPTLLSKVSATGALTRDQASKVEPLLAQLTAIRDQMASKRRPNPDA